MKKFIAITQRLVENQSYVEEREALALDWGVFFREYLREFIPLPLSYAIPFNVYAKMLGDSLVGVILSGGNDLGELNPSALSLKRDAYEEEILEFAKEGGTPHLPLLGICRGAQRIAYSFGSTLERVSGHVGAHTICTKKGEFVVNSYHNYGILKLGEGLEGRAFSADGTCESFCHKEFAIYGMMWHIEREQGMSEDNVFQSWLQDVYQYTRRKQ